MKKLFGLLWLRVPPADRSMLPLTAIFFYFVWLALSPLTIMVFAAIGWMPLVLSVGILGFMFLLGIPFSVVATGICWYRMCKNYY
ncbi:MAG: hypothetical protein HYT93_02585 [Parcubacteria group bacterium]|nr:hypothetical protein [Parcubacteria group bacterium]